MNNNPATPQEKVPAPVLVPVHDKETFYDQAIYLHGEIRKNELIVATHSSSNTMLFRTPTSGLRALMATLSLSSNGRFSCLVDIAVTDKLKVKGRFVLKYLLLSPGFSARVNVETFATETSQIPSIAGAFFTNKAIFASAGWLEREVWDLFGIFSQGNPDLRRILTDYGFAGHPFRKDFPVTGFIELFYNDSEGRVVSEPVELAQELRIFHL